MSIVQIIGEVGSGKTTTLGANAIVQAMEGKTVLIITDEHRTADVYLRPNQWIKAEYDVLSNIKMVYTTDTDMDNVLDIIKVQNPEVLMLDFVDNRIQPSRIAHEYLSTIHKQPVVYSVLQVQRGYLKGE